MGYVRNVIRMYYDMLVKREYEVVGVLLYGSQNYWLLLANSALDNMGTIIKSFIDKHSPSNDLVEFNEKVSTGGGSALIW